MWYWKKTALLAKKYKGVNQQQLQESAMFKETNVLQTEHGAEKRRNYI